MSFVLISAALLSGVVTSTSIYILYNKFCVKIEYFGTLPPKTTKINREILVNSATDTAYSVNGNYQSTLSPRFINTNVGANIRYHLPDNMNMMAAPQFLPTTRMQQYRSEERPLVTNIPNNSNSSTTSNPSTTRSTLPLRPARTDSQPSAPNGKTLSGCGNGTKMGPSSSSYQVPRSVVIMDPPGMGRASGNKPLRVVDTLPVDNSDIAMDTLNRQGSEIVVQLDEQPLIYDRFMFANSKSRLRSRADMFRGDLPIIPVLPQSSPESGVWFRPSVTPHIDLERGYISAAGGINNESNNKLRDLMIASSGGTLSTFGGASVNLQRSIINTSAGDLMVSSFV